MFNRKLFSEIFKNRFGVGFTEQMLDVVEVSMNETFIQGFEKGEQSGYDKAVEDFTISGNDENLND